MPNFLKNYRLMLVLGVIVMIASIIIFAKIYRQALEVRTVIKAATDITSQVKITPKEIKTDEISGTLPADVVTKTEEIEGLFAKGFIPGDTVLRKSMFQPNGGIGVEGELVNYPGCFGISFAADIYTTVGGNTAKGSKVVIYEIDKAQKKSNKIGDGIPVVSINGQDNTSKSLTVALKPEQADQVVDSLSRGCTFLFALQPKG